MLAFLGALALAALILAQVQAIFAVSHARADSRSIDTQSRSKRQPICNEAGPWNTWLLG